MTALTDRRGATATLALLGLISATTLPAPAFLLVLSGHLLGTLAGTFAAARLGGSAIPAYVVGAILLAAGIGNAFMIPQPAWFSAVSIVGYVVMTLVGARLGRGGAS